MKKLIATVLLLCLIVSITGCGKIEPIETRYVEPDVSTPDQAVMEQPTDEPPTTEPFHPIEQEDGAMYALSLPPVKETVPAEDGGELLYLSFQRAQLLMPDEEVSESILGDLQTRMSFVLAQAPDLEITALENYEGSDSWNPYFVDASYTPTRLDRSVLSLFGNHTTYSGGSHPALTTDSVTYDLESGRSLYLDEVLTRKCSNGVLSDLIVEVLSEQAENLSSDYIATVRNRFSTALHNIKDWYFSKNGLCFHFAPYLIAPYSSGTIIAEIPYDRLEGLLVEAYFPDPVGEGTGSMYAEFYLEHDEERFTSIADVDLVEGGTEILLYSDATVTDVRVEMGTRYSDTGQYIPGAIIFAANIVDIGDAIRLTMDLEDPDTMIRLIYHCGEKEYSAFVAYDEMGDSIMLAHG